MKFVKYFKYTYLTKGMQVRVHHHCVSLYVRDMVTEAVSLISQIHVF